MKTIKYSVAYYKGIGEAPMVILLDRPIGEFKRQYDDINDLINDISLDAIIYFVADKLDNRIPDLSNWHEGKFDFDKLKLL